jgi:hypothetical protein
MDVPWTALRLFSLSLRLRLRLCVASLVAKAKGIDHGYGLSSGR